MGPGVTTDPGQVASDSSQSSVCDLSYVIPFCMCHDEKMVGHCSCKCPGRVDHQELNFDDYFLPFKLLNSPYLRRLVEACL